MDGLDHKHAESYQNSCNDGNYEHEKYVVAVS